MAVTEGRCPAALAVPAALTAGLAARTQVRSMFQTRHKEPDSIFLLPSFFLFGHLRLAYNIK
jgi:hypothetical protein